MLPTRGPGPRGHRGPGVAARVAAAVLATTGALATVAVTSGAATTTAPLIPFGATPATGLGRPVTAPVPPSTRDTIDLVMPPAAAPAARRAVGAWLKDAGLRPTAVGNALQASSSTAAVGRLLGIGFRHYRLGNDLVVAASSRPRVPASIAPDLTAILGLSTAPLAGAGLTVLPGSAHPWTPPAGPALRPSVATSSSGPTLRPAAVTAPTACAPASQEAASYSGAATLDQVGDHYGVGSLLAAGDGGAGMTIAALELAPSSASDIGAYDACFGLDAARYSVQTVDTGGTPSSAGTAEADVDVEQLQTQAPLANVVSYEGPNGGSGFYDTLSAIVNAPVAQRAQVVSISWGACEAAFGSTSITAFEPLFAQAARQGQTVLVASGDTGSEGCYPAGGSTALAVSYPASDPNVTAVGGTVVTSGSADVVWNACATATSSACAAGTASETGPGILGASGGGVSAVIAEPAFQTPAGTFSGRGVPDLAADASGLVAYVTGAWIVAAGTSLSAPLVAGIVADVAPTYATPIGDLAPSLYAYWQRYGYSTALAAVTSGNNDWTDSYNHADETASATPGYNLATGLGTPIATGLVGPQVTGLSSAATGGGRSLTIDGTNLEDTTVTLGGTPATVTAPSSTSLAVTVPPGADTADVVVSNPIGSAAPAALPTITSADVLTATVGTASSFTVTASGAADPVLAEAGPLPAGLTFSDNTDGTATLAGTPATGTGGVYPLVLSATTPEGTSTQAFTLTVDEIPTFTSPATISFSTTGPATFAPAVTGYPAPTVTESGTLPAGVTFQTANGTTPAELTGTATTTGTYPVRFTATSTAGSTTQDATLDVAGGPAFTSTAGSAIFDPTTGGSYTFSATASSTVTYAETGTLPSGLALSSAGVLSGTPAAGTAGSYPIVVTARDGQGATTEQFRVDVPQITSAATATFGAGRPGAFPVVATGLPGATFTESGALPAGVTLASTGLLAGTPAAGTAGGHQVTVTATGDGTSLSQTLTVQVDVPPAFTSPTAATFAEGQAGTFTVTASGAPAPVFAETGALPSGVTLSPDGFLSGAPATGTAGTYPVTLAADNPGGLLREPFALTVLAATTTGGGGAPTGGGGAPTGGGAEGAPAGGGAGGAPAGGGGGASGPTTPPPTNPAPVPVPITPPPVVAPAPRPVVTATAGPAGPGRVAGIARVAGGHLYVTVACAQAACRGTVTLLVGTTPVSVPRAYGVAAGRTGTFRVTLDKAGLARLVRARGHVVVVTERVTVAGGAAATRVVRLEPAPVARATTSLADVTGGHLYVTVACAQAACRGTVTLLVGTTPVSVPRAYGVAAGRTGTFRVTLDKAGLARLVRARGHVVVVTERVTVAGGAAATRVVRLEPRSARTAPTRAALRRPASPGGRTRPGPG